MRSGFYNIRSLLASSAFFLALLCSNAYADGTSFTSRPPRGAERVLPSGLFLLDLSNDQVSFIESIVEAHKDSLKALLDEEDTQRKALDEAINKDTVDETAVRDASKNLAAVKEELFVLKANVVNRIRAVLTSSQKSQLDSAQELVWLSNYRLLGLFPFAPRSSGMDESNS